MHNEQTISMHVNETRLTLPTLAYNQTKNRDFTQHLSPSKSLFTPITIFNGYEKID